MLRKITVRNLKRLREAEIPLTDSVILAGPNNFGKTTTLQALSIWYLATQRWIAARETTGSKAKERTGVPLARKDFTAVPVRSLDLLWTDRAVGRKKGEAKPPLIEIVVEGLEGDAPWSWGMELQYQGSELLYCRAIEKGATPDPVRDLTVVHVPPLGGIQTDEEKRERGIQDRLIGEGRPGEIIRNLLLQVSEESPGDWKQLASQVFDMFQVELHAPNFTGTYITCEYTPRYGRGMKHRELDIANAGSGFHQVLLLLAFFYARPGSVLLLDEPDAHLHVILQRDVYALIRRVAAERRSQLLISTHSEVILDETSPAKIVAFTGDRPHPLVNTSQKSQLKKAIDKLRSLDFVLADQVGAVLYVEGDTDAAILREWARILNHPSYPFLEKPYLHPIGGNDPNEVLDHYFAIREAYPNIRAVGVLDRRDRPLREDWPGPPTYVWSRREIENYLLIPDLIKRYVTDHAPLGPLTATVVDSFFDRQLPRGFDPLNDSLFFLTSAKGSDDVLLPLMSACGIPTSKNELFLLAAIMKPEEFHPEIVKVLDLIATLGPEQIEPERPIGGPVVRDE